MMLTKSQWVLILASIVTLYFTWAALKSDASADISLPTRTLSKASLPEKTKEKPAENLASFDLQQNLQTRDLVPLVGDLFTAPKPIVEAPAPVAKTKFVAPPIPKPVAPPLPFKYVGRFQDDDKNAVLIDYRDEIIAVKVGDIVANQYKVVAINESANSIQIQFLMMPFNPCKQGQGNHE
jgi:hypothetical protein